jgi:hypothetical protein
MVEATTRNAGPPVSRQSLLQKAKSSPEIAGEHDKARWLALYSDDAILEDPVGTPASMRGRRAGRFGDEIGRFYEAFIRPSGIEMVSRKDIVSDMHVFRAVDIHTTHLGTGLKMIVPANLLYEIVRTGDGLEIRRMQAHWELSRMSRKLMAEGLTGARTIASMNWSMLRAFGPRWLMRYFKASQEGVGRRGKSVVQGLASDMGSGGGERRFSSDATIELPGGASPSQAELFAGCTSLEVRDLLASGRTVSGLATIEWGGRIHEAGFIAELDSAAERITRLRFFWEP